MVEKETIVNDLPDNVVDTAQLCKVFGVTRQAIYKWRKNGLPTVVWKKNGTVRYNMEEVIMWLNENAANGPQGT